MKVHSFAIAALCTAVVVEASTPHHLRTVNSRHARLARRDGTKRCRARTPPANSQNLTGNQDQNKDQNQNQNQNQNQGQDQNKDQNKDQNQNQGQGQGQNQNQDQNKGNNGNNSNGGSVTTTIEGLLNVASTCGDIGATKDVTATTGPNGALDWLNCGINNGGWRPQDVKISDLKVADLREAIQSSDSPFKACSDYIDKFYTYGNEFDVPPIVMASFAMQESGCNPSVTGGGGECGMMQLSSDKWGGAPGGNCYDVDFNIRTATEYFKKSLDQFGGNVLKAAGTYNGWKEGMTFDSATAARYTSCCRCQNNLDYIFQLFNGWLLNKNPYTRQLGQYFNLQVCN